jgi:hypothetical protein
MRKRTQRAPESLVPWILLILSSVALLAGAVLLPQRDGQALAQADSPDLPSTNSSEGSTEEITPRQEEKRVTALKTAFNGVQEGSYRSVSVAGETRVSLETWGDPVELILSLYLVAAAGKLLRFRLQEEESRYHLSVELRDE